MNHKTTLLPLLSILLLTLTGCKTKKESYAFSYFKGNGEDGLHLAYSHDGLKWAALKNDNSFLQPTVSNDKLMRDPCIVKGGDGLFHMVWTVSWSAKGIGYATSADLVHWSPQQYIPVMEHEQEARNCWAPEITYDSDRQLYLIYWATTIRGSYPETQVAADDGYNHRLYATTTKDFKTFSKTTLLYEPGFNVIDATIVKDGGKWTMFLKDETREPAKKNLRTATSRALEGPYSEPSAPFSGKSWAEGPTTLKIKDTWMVYFDKYMDGRYGMVTSKDLKNWQDQSEQLVVPEGIRHGTVFPITAKELKKLQQQ